MLQRLFLLREEFESTDQQKSRIEQNLDVTRRENTYFNAAAYKNNSLNGSADRKDLCAGYARFSFLLSYTMEISLMILH